MTTKVSRVQVRFEVDGDGNVKAAFEQLGKGAEQSARQVDRAADRMTRLTSAAKTAGTVLGGVLVAGLGLYIRNTIEAEKVDAQLEARLRSTAGAAGLTKRQLDELAEATARKTTFDDEAVKSAEALLLTFTRIGGDVFPRAIDAITDMSVAMEQDLQTSVIQVGKALNDPIQGVAALTRVGVQFSDQQKDLIEKLVETGRVAEAQAVILAELETQFGGAAEAARDTLGGALQALKNAFDDLLEGDAGSAGVKDVRNGIEELTATLNDPEVRQGFQTLITFALSATSAIAGLGAEYQNAVERVSISIGILAKAAEGTREFQSNLLSLGAADGSLVGGFERFLAGFEEGQNELDALIARQEEAARRANAPEVRLITGSRGAIDEDDRRIGVARPPPPSLGRRRRERRPRLTEEQRAAQQLQRDYERLRDSLLEQTALNGEVTEAARVRYEVEKGELAALEPARKQELIRLAEQRDAQERAQKLMEEGKQLTESLLTPTEQLNAERARAKELLDAGAISQDAYNRVLEATRGPAEQLLEDLRFEYELLRMTNAERATAIQLRGLDAEAVRQYGAEIAAMNAQIDQRRKDIQFMDEFRDGLAQLGQTAIYNFGQIDESFKDMMDGLAKQVTRRILEGWIESIFGAKGATGQGTSGGDWLSGLLSNLFGSGGGGGGNAGGGWSWLGSLFGGGGSTGGGWWSWLGSLFGGGRATGGPVQAGHLYRVNELRPELLEVGGNAYLMMGGRNGRVVANPQMTAPAPVINQSFTTVVQGLVSSRTPEQVARANGREARRAMARTGA